MKAPLPCEFELCIFGKGFGESMLIHIGNNDWIVVDSCLDKDDNPCGLNYLDKIGVESNNIIHIIATHWDTDHIKGISKICEKAKNSFFVFSKAMQEPEFLRLIFGLSDIPGATKSSTHEFNKILEIFNERISDNNSVEKFILASEFTIIHQDSITLEGIALERQILALSPSYAAQIKSLQSIAKLIPKKLEPLRNIRELRPNHTSIVLLLKIGDLCLLLGSDLEELGVNDDGWSAIVNGRINFSNKAEVFKIPHHGSKNGHHEKVWDKFVAKNNISLVTPFHHGRTKIPSKDDLQRITHYSKKAYIAGASKIKKVRANQKEKGLLRKINKLPYRVERKLGRVILRKSIINGNSWSIVCDGEAHSFKDLML